MAIGAADMAESIEVGYLYHDRRGSAAGARVERHDHACCQLELFAAGRASFLAGLEHDLGPGDGLLLPPGCSHAIHYRSDCRYLSIKFAWRGPDLGDQAIPVGDSPLRQALERAIDACLVDDRAEPERGARLVLEHCLAALVVALRPPPERPPPGDPLLAQIAAVLRARAGRPLGVAELARRVGLSPSRLSARIRAATGAGAKHLIDQARAEEAARQLAYAERDIAGIAELLGFPDPFTFSRFFSRCMGCSPRAWRRRHRAR